MPYLCPQAGLLAALPAVAAAGCWLWRKLAALRLAERVAERERIARTLHDAILQSVQGLILGCQNALDGLSGERRHQLERMLRLAHRVLEDGRNEVHELRASAMRDGDLAHGLGVVGALLREQHGAAFGLASAGRARPLADGVACEVYRIVREALMNAFRHAGAATVRVELRYGEHRFSVLVHDDGAGIPAEVLAGGARPGHWGLPGMAERAARVGARLRIVSGAGSGTRLRLTLPAARAYPGRKKGGFWPICQVFRGRRGWRGRFSGAGKAKIQ